MTDRPPRAMTLHGRSRARGVTPSKGSGRPILFAVTVTYLIVVPTLLGWPPITWAPATVLSIATMIYAAVRLGHLVSAPVPPIAHCLALAFAYVFLGLAPFYQLSYGVFPDVEYPGPSHYGHGVLTAASALAFASTIATDLVAARFRGAHARGAPRALPPSVAIAAVTLAVASAGVAVAYIGFDGLFSSREEAFESLCPGLSGYLQLGDDRSTCGLIQAAIRVPPVFAAAAMLSVWLSDRRAAITILTVLVIAIVFMTSNPLSTSRFWVVVAGFTIVSPLLIRSLSFRRFVLFSVPLLTLAVFPAADFARWETWESVAIDPVGAMLTKRDFDVYQLIANAWVYLELWGTQGGLQSASAAFIFIPRSFWLDKSIPTGDVVAHGVGYYEFTALSAPPAVEGLIDFGLPGAILFAAGLGIAIASIDRRASTTSAAAILWIPYAGFIPFIARGPLMGATPYLFAMAAVHIVLWLFAVRISQPREGPACEAVAVPTALYRKGLSNR